MSIFRKSLAVFLYAGSLFFGGTQAVFALDALSAMTEWQAWVSGLSAQGYAVSQGSAWKIDTAGCAQITTVFGNCFGNNAAAPYIVPQPPVGAGYHVDPTYGNPFLTGNPPASAQSNMVFRASEGDAIINVVNLPPQAAYFGYQSYLFSRLKSLYTTTPPRATLAPPAIADSVDARYEIFGSLGNSINNIVIAQQLGAVPWEGGPVVFITTANSQLADALKTDAIAKGLDSRRIFVEAIGQNSQIGTHASADDFLTLIRYALPKDDAAGNQWRSNNANNVRVFRVAAPSGFTVQRYATPSYSPKLPTSEAIYQNSLNELALLLQNWLGSKRGYPATLAAMTISAHVNSSNQPYGLVGASCIAAGNNCLGDSQDTDAYRLGAVGTMSNRQMAIVAGVNATQTGNASYTSLAINDVETFTGVASLSQTNPDAVGFNSGSLTGSAEQLLIDLGLYGHASAQLKSDLPYLYAAIVARSCSYTSRNCIAIDNTEIPANHHVSITQRAYIKPGQSTSASPDAMLNPLVIYRPNTALSGEIQILLLD
jgi:hypothetical protein